MGGDNSVPIQVNTETSGEKNLITLKLLVQLCSESFTLQNAIKFLQNFCKNYQINPPKELEIILKNQLMKNTNIFTLNELIGFVKNHVPKSRFKKKYKKTKN